MIRQTPMISVALAVLMASGCPSATEGEVAPTLTIADVASNPGDVAPTDATSADDGLGLDLDSEATASDVPGGGDVLGDADTNGLEPGEAYWPCAENADCDSGYCLESYGGKQCAIICESECPSGFECQQDLSAFPDLIFVCVASFPRLCYPCDTDADCREASDELHTCIPLGGPLDGKTDGKTDGAFCGAACGGSPCPDDWVCAVAQGADGSTSQQCIPSPLAHGEPGVCACPTGAVAAAASTSCSRTIAVLGTCVGARTCTAEGLTDCDAAVPESEVCDAADNDCNGVVDDIEASACQATNDFGTCGGTTECDIAGNVVCDALVPSAEVCDDVDNDCDGGTDDTVTAGCTDYYQDGDGDDFGTGAASCQCGPQGLFTATKDGDCDDTQALVHPSAVEVCNGTDDNCSGETDEELAVGCSLWNLDDDEDGFGHPTQSKCFCGPTGKYTTKSNTDCDDTTDQANPGTAEVCDLIDNDCDSQIDELGSGGCTIYYVDADADQYGDQTQFACLCAASQPYVVDAGGDCNEEAGSINPGADEQCDLVDNDCDGATDEPGAGGCTNYYRDGDGDGYGVTADFLCLCGPLGVYDAELPGDCNDGTGAVSPAVTETCNGIDDNCNDIVDDEGSTGCFEYYEDGDGDGYGVGDPQCLCGATGDFRALVPGDCVDTDPTQSPGQPEVCGGDTDDNCDGVKDEAGAVGCFAHFVDVDGDGFGDPTTEICLCAPSGGAVGEGGDCDDTPVTGFGVNPGVTEACNASDDDCDGVIDNGCGMATAGWPTYKYDGRRTGHRKDVEGPDTNTLAWKVVLPTTDRGVETSPLVLADGHILYAYNDVVYKLARPDGAILWQTTLPVGFTNSQQVEPRAGPTVREGGTIYVPTGNGMSLLAPDGTLLWHKSLGPDPEDAVRGTPLVDEDGDAYFISNKFFTRMNPAGDIVWQLSIPNVQYTPGHAAWNLAQDRMYFTATNHVTYAVERSGFVAWTFIDTGADIDGSCTVGADGLIYSSMGRFIYKIEDQGFNALQQGVYDTGQDIDSCPAIYDDGAAEHVWIKPNGSNNDLLKISAASMTLEGGYDLNSNGGPASAPVFDADGDVYMGAGSGATFHALRQDTTVKWTFGLDNNLSDGTAALGPGFVVFSDNGGVVYLIAD